MKQSRKGGNQKQILLKLLFLLFLLLAVISIWNILTILQEYRTAEHAVAEMQQFIELEATQPPEPVETEPAATVPEAAAVTEEQADTDETVPEDPTQPTEDPYSYPVVDFEALLQINPDVIGWIYVEDTQISYPIVQGTDNKKYVKQMVDGRYNAAGSIFMDYQNEADFSDRNTVIYGHNMKNGSMFAQITHYRKSHFFKAHPTGVIVTPNRNFRFEVIAGYVTDVSDDAWKIQFAGDEEYLLWLQDAMNRSVIGGTFAVSESDRVITLSTCTYEFDNARFVLVCRIIE